jgi:hypothetical protein
LDGHPATPRARAGRLFSAPEVFKASFRNIKRKSSFSIESNLGGITYHGNISPKKTSEFEFSAEKIVAQSGAQAGRSNRGQNLGTKGVVGQRLDRGQGVCVPFRLLNDLNEDEKNAMNDVADFAIYSLSTPILRGASSDSSHKEPLGLYGGSLAVALADVIKDHHKAASRNSDLNRFFRLMNWIDQIGTTSRISSELQSSHIHTSNMVVSYRDKFMKTNFNKLYAYDVSEGALYILFVIVLLLHKESPNIFALDNADNALNPGLIRSLMDHVIEMLEVNPRKQMLITTHNPTTLDSIDLFNSKHRLFVVQRNSEGHTEITRIHPPAGFDRTAWVEKHGAMKLSELWLSGILGGISPGEAF